MVLKSWNVNKVAIGQVMYLNVFKVGFMIITHRVMIMRTTAMHKIPIQIFFDVFNKKQLTSINKIHLCLRLLRFLSFSQNKGHSCEKVDNETANY